MNGVMKKVAQLTGLGIATLLSSQIYASGYKLEFQSASMLADSGDAAVINDASTNWYNSAGLVYLPQQLVGGGVGLYQDAKFTGQVNAPSVIPFPPSNFSQYGTASSHTTSFLPEMHYSLPFRDRFAFGISVVPAWGLVEDYGENSILRYDLTRIYTRTLDVAPSLAMKIDQHWSVGLGPDFHYMSLQSKSYVNTVTPATSDSISRFTGNNWGHGAHIGILYRYDDTTRVGLNYRSKIVMNLKGYSDFSGSGIGSFESDAFQLNIPLPPTTTLSVYHDMTPCWAMMGTIAYDQWGVLNHYHAQSYMQPTGPIPSVVLPQNFSNTFDLSVGTHLKLDQQWMLRGSLKYEGTPTNNSFRDVNFPDGQKLGINLGARYRMRKNLAFDFVVAHVFTRSVHINGVNPLTGATAIGHENVSIDLAGAQIVWDI